MPPDDATGTALFRELRGDYVDGAGQVVNVPGYLDYFEPLGTALSKLRDGVGGPFLYQVKDTRGRVIGATGWIVNASSQRNGAWKLWGMWAERPIPPLTLPLLWPDLSDPDRLSHAIERANENADLLLDDELFDQLDINTKRLHDDAFRATLKLHLSRAYGRPASRERPIEVEVSRNTLDLLPWLYLLGPIEPSIAQVQPNRFNGAGYQYIFTDPAPPEVEGDIPPEVDTIVDTAAGDLLEGWTLAAALREERSRPRPVERPAARRAPLEISEMQNPPTPRSTSPRPRPKPVPSRAAIYDIVRDAIVVALLAWIAINVQAIRTRPTPVTDAATTTAAPSTAEPPAPPATRQERLADTLATNPLQGIRIAPAALESTSALDTIAIEVFLRRNRCFSGTEAVDGRLSSAEQKAMRACTALTRERLVNRNFEPDGERAMAWLEREVAK